MVGRPLGPPILYAEAFLCEATKDQSPGSVSYVCRMAMILITSPLAAILKTMATPNILLRPLTRIVDPGARPPHTEKRAFGMG